MAVKPEIIKARLKVLFPKANLSTKRIDAIAAKLAPMPADDADDAAVDVVLNLANDFNSFEDIAREDDRIRTLEAKASTAPTPASDAEPAPVNTPVPDDTPAWAKAIIDANQKLVADMEAIKTGKILETKKQTAQSVFESSEVLKALKPEIKANWLNRIDVHSETPIEDQVKNLETEFTDIRQEIANTTKYSSVVPSFTSKDGKPDEKDVANIVDGLI
ncbi:MAG TPA: hypothetical protein VF677_11820 [Flavobacterium sp.]